MKPTLKKLRRGFTILELTIAMMMGLATGSMVITLFNQQLVFLNVFKTQTFLTEEAPLISMYVGRMVGKADRFRLHASVSDALSGANPLLTSSPNLPPVVYLNFRQPDGTMRASILSFEARNGGEKALYYYLVPVSGVLGEPQWAVTRSPENVTFEVVQGVLRMTLTGPAGEQITYSGTMQQ